MAATRQDAQTIARALCRIELESRWRTPSHGHGRLLPFQPGNKLGGRRGTIFTDTQRLAREYSTEAVQTLAARLHDRDGRVAVAAAIALLERAWGRVGTARPEDVQPPVQIDLSGLSSAELQILLDLAASGRLRAASSDGVSDAPPEPPLVIEAEPVDAQ
jgi:hypothetical protein